MFTTISATSASSARNIGSFDASNRIFQNTIVIRDQRFFEAAVHFWNDEQMCIVQILVPLQLIRYESFRLSGWIISDKESHESFATLRTELHLVDVCSENRLTDDQSRDTLQRVTQG